MSGRESKTKKIAKKRLTSARQEVARDESEEPPSARALEGETLRAAPGAAPEVQEQVAAAAIAMAAGMGLEGIPATRREMIDSLPSIASANALVAANDCISLKVVALRNGAAAAGYYDESSTPDQIDKAEEFNRRRMNKLIEERGDGYSLADLCEGGVVDVAAARSGTTKNRRNGVIVARIDESWFDYFYEAIREEYMVSPNDADMLDFECLGDEKFYPGAVLEQLHAQNGGMNSMVRYNRDTRGNIYTFSFPTDAAYEEAVRREHIVKLGAHGTLQFRPVQRRPANEEFFIYGLTGVGSAKDYMVPQIACNMGVSKDLVRASVAQGVRDGIGALIKVVVPYSKANYGRLMKLLATAHFKLIIEGHALEITVAATPVEIGKLLNFQIMSAEREEDEEDEVEALDLRIEDITAPGTGAHTPPNPAHAFLVSDWLWRLHGKVGREAAARARECMPRLVAASTMHVRPCSAARSTGTRSCSYPTHSSETHACYISRWQPSDGLGSVGRQEAATRRHNLGRQGYCRDGSEARAVCSGRLWWAAWGLQTGQHWEWRPMDHLLRWGFDARACGEGKSK
jgi:hypothetical protein